MIDKWTQNNIWWTKVHHCDPIEYITGFWPNYNWEYYGWHSHIHWTVLVTLLGEFLHTVEKCQTNDPAVFFITELFELRINFSIPVLRILTFEFAFWFRRWLYPTGGGCQESILEGQPPRCLGGFSNQRVFELSLCQPSRWVFTRPAGAPFRITILQCQLFRR